MERSRAEQEFKPLNERFEPNSVHLSIMKEAKQKGGVYDQKKALEKIQASLNEEKLKKQMMGWNETNLENLVEAGYLIKISDMEYMANPLALEIKKKEFKPGKNHIKLMQKGCDGIIKVSDLKKEHENKSESEQKRQNTFTDGMVKKLYENNYLDRIGKGQYKLTKKAHIELEEAKKVMPATRKEATGYVKKEFTITTFDRHIKEVMQDGKISQSLVELHPKRDSIIKRIESLKKNNLITKDGMVTNEFTELLDRRIELSKCEMLTIDKLTMEQLQLIKDLRIFQNLSKTQIRKYVYKGNKLLAAADIDFLIRKKVIKKDENMWVYVMDKVGIAMSNELFPEAVKYSTKIESRQEELEHDMLVYSAYSEWAKRIVAAGGKILEIKNDRQLRREDAKEYGHMVGAYPDLRVIYTLPSSVKKLVYDIEMDCGYDGKTIQSKMTGMLSGANNVDLGWFCKSLYQATKVANILTKDTTKVSRMNVARKMTVFYMDKDGNLKTVCHRHWDK